MGYDQAVGESEAARQQVIDQITRAFDGISREDGVSFHEALALDDYATEEQRAEARKLDTETRWQDVPEEDIEQMGFVALSFFDPKGFRYYLPAFMIWTLRNFETTGSGTPESTVFHLELDRITPDHEYSLSRFRSLNPDQSSAVCAFLRYMEAHMDRWHAKNATQALTDHWAQFCTF